MPVQGLRRGPSRINQGGVGVAMNLARPVHPDGRLDLFSVQTNGMIFRNAARRRMIAFALVIIQRVGIATSRRGLSKHPRLIQGIPAPQSTP